MDRLVAHIESERAQLNHVRDELGQRIDTLESLFKEIIKRNGNGKNGKISIREIAAWSTAIVTGLAAVVQYLK